METANIQDEDFNEGIDEDEGIGMDRYLFQCPKNKVKEDRRGPWMLGRLEEIKMPDI